MRKSKIMQIRTGKKELLHALVDLQRSFKRLSVKVYVENGVVYKIRMDYGSLGPIQKVEFFERVRKIMNLNATWDLLDE